MIHQFDLLWPRFLFDRTPPFRSWWSISPRFCFLDVHSEFVAVKIAKLWTKRKQGFYPRLNEVVTFRSSFFIACILSPLFLNVSLSDNVGVIECFNSSLPRGKFEFSGWSAVRYRKFVRSKACYQPEVRVFRWLPRSLKCSLRNQLAPQGWNSLNYVVASSTFCFSRSLNVPITREASVSIVSTWNVSVIFALWWKCYRILNNRGIIAAKSPLFDSL